MTRLILMQWAIINLMFLMVSFWDRNGEKNKQISLRQYVFSWVNSISLFYYVNQYSVRVMYVFKHYFFHSLSFQYFCYSKYFIESNYCTIYNLKSLLTIRSSINPLIILHTQTESHAHTNCHMHKMTFTTLSVSLKQNFTSKQISLMSYRTNFTQLHFTILAIFFHISYKQK